MQTKTIALSLIDINEGQIQGLPRNPRTWSLRQLKKLAASIERTPELLEARPPIVVQNEGRFVAIGGNMRVSACQYLGKESMVCTVLAADELPAAKLKEIAIKDNSNFGHWDTDALANEWSDYDLPDFGLPDFGGISSAPGNAPAKPVDDRTAIEITLSPDEFNFVTDALRKIDPSPENAVCCTMANEHLFPYRWKMSDGYPAPGIRHNGLKVFGTFVCGGGSTMGYKLAGYDHLGGVEIDPKVAAIYKDNHAPVHLYVEDLRVFNQREDLPAELYQLDLLDGSPPCSTFSMAGNREKAWGKEKVFAEGQALQTLDDLVFVYCETIKKLRPKTFILENVSGLAKGNAKSYLKRIFTTLQEAGYKSQVFLLNAATMGVPQIRERTFVIGHRAELGYQPLKLDFHETPIYFSEVMDKTDTHRDISDNMMTLFEAVAACDTLLSHTRLRLGGKWTGYTQPWVAPHRVCQTLTTGSAYLTSFPRELNEKELRLIAGFPEDYKAPNKGRLRWLTGMSVPPPMIAQIANQIALQWLLK